MTLAGSGNARQLHTLERLRTMELEDAKNRYSALAAIAAEKQSVMERVQREVSEAQDQVRDSLAAGSLSVDALRRQAAFAELLGQRLSKAETERGESQAKASEAREVVLRRFEQLSTIERLRERREVERSRHASRQVQQQLDELALTRCGVPGKNNTTGE